jgi:Spy/CpxP family protein refolding chaperone
MKKRLMMVMAAGLLSFNTASAATDCMRPADCDPALRDGRMCNPPAEGKGANREKWQQNDRCSRAGAPMHRMHHQGRNGVNCSITDLRQHLGLGNREAAEIEKLRDKHFTLMRQEHQELATLQDDLRLESLKNNPDKNKIEDLAVKIGNKHTAIARLQSTHIKEVSSVLTPAQRDKMQKFMADGPMRSHGGRVCPK